MRQGRNCGLLDRFLLNALDALLQQLGRYLHRADLSLGSAHRLGKFLQSIQRLLAHRHFARVDPGRVAGPSGSLASTWLEPSTENDREPGHAKRPAARIRHRPANPVPRALAIRFTFLAIVFTL